MQNENQNTEYKLLWKDDYLKWVCGFANADGGTIFIGVDDKGEVLGLENPKKLLEDLPKGWTTETLKIKHTSEPANPNIAKAFFRAGYIETWGRGTLNMVEYCTRVGLPEPVFEGKWGGLAVIFNKTPGIKPWETSDGVTDKNSESRKDFGKISESSPESSPKSSSKSSFNSLQKIIKLIEDNPFITTVEIAKIIGMSKRAVLKNTKKLKDQGRLKRVGPNKGGYWEIIKNEY